MPTTKLSLLSRPAFEERCAGLSGWQVSIAMLDLDHFAQINDEYGHAAGDDVLRSLENVLTGSLPLDALVGRFGGDEYVVALPE
ncbi:MAG TPA: GGDEF domain-containing protein, partial [Chloroflexota bacterium]|nr:GGDEF domain-containing protein [Chloroflexota bacterium]